MNTLTDEINWDNLESCSVRALRFACSQRKLKPAFPNKSCYIAVLKEYRDKQRDHLVIQYETPSNSSNLVHKPTQEPADIYFQPNLRTQGWAAPSGRRTNNQLDPSIPKPSRYLKQSIISNRPLPPTPPKPMNRQNQLKLQPKIIDFKSDSDTSYYSDYSESEDQSPSIHRRSRSPSVSMQMPNKQNRKKIISIYSTIMILIIFMIIFLLVA